MIEQTAVVIRLDGQFALVEAQRESSCGQCNAKKGCGTGILENSLGRRVMRLKAINQCNALPGDEVVVAVPEKGFIKSAFFTYLLPLLLMLLGAVVAQQMPGLASWNSQDLVALLGAGVGFAVALLLLRRYSLQMEKDASLQPVVVRKSRPPLKVNIAPSENSQQLF
jgi:sigma-E factor negative regulatory protein RseC